MLLKSGGIGSTRSHTSTSTTHMLNRGGTREAYNSSQASRISNEYFRRPHEGFKWDSTELISPKF